MIFHKSKMLAAALLIAAATLPAAAGNGWGAWMHWGAGQSTMGRWGGGPMDYGLTTDRIDGRLAFLKAELKITDAQAAAWDALVSAVRDTADAHDAQMQGMMAEMQSGDFEKLSLPDRLAFKQSNLEMMLDEVKSVSDSLDKLYAVLDDAQKKTADQMVLPVMGMGGSAADWGAGMMNH